MPLYTQQIQLFFPPPQNDIQLLLLQFTKKETKRLFSPMLLIFVERCIARFVSSHLILSHTYPYTARTCYTIPLCWDGYNRKCRWSRSSSYQGPFPTKTSRKCAETIYRCALLHCRHWKFWLFLLFSSLHTLGLSTTYLVEYVTCKTCRSLDTLLTKENRIFFMACESCGSRRSVNAIKSGFQAQVGKRSKNKTG